MSNDDLTIKRCVQTASELRAGIEELHRCIVSEDMNGARQAFARIEVPSRNFCIPVRHARGVVTFLSTIRGRLLDAELTRAQRNRLASVVHHLLVCVEHAFVAQLPAEALTGANVAWLRIPSAIVSKVRFALTLENAAPSVAGAQLREAIEIIKMHFGTDDSRARTLLKEAARRAAEVQSRS